MYWYLFFLFTVLEKARISQLPLYDFSSFVLQLQSRCSTPRAQRTGSSTLWRDAWMDSGHQKACHNPGTVRTPTDPLPLIGRFCLASLFFISIFYLCFVQFVCVCFSFIIFLIGYQLTLCCRQGIVPLKWAYQCKFTQIIIYA